MIRIACVGDIMPGGILHNKDVEFIDKEVEDYLSLADVRVGTLECAVGDKPTFDPEKMCRKQDIVYTPNADLIRVKSLGVNVVSLANNHIYDLGHNGLVNTIEQLKKLGIQYCGAGNNLEEASRPAVVEVNNKKLAFLAYCDYQDKTVGYVPFAEAGKSGVNPMYTAHVLSEIQKYKKIYDYVFVITHWGTEHTYFPLPEVWKLSRQMVQAGADGIIGGHTHRVQPILDIEGKPVIFSLGNFSFFDRYINAPRPTYYPAPEENTDNYPITYEYPYVKEPTLKLWPYLARIGMIVQLTIDDHGVCRCDRRYTFLNERNKIVFFTPSKIIKFKLNLIKLLLGLPVYPLFYSVLRKGAQIKSKLLSR